MSLVLKHHQKGPWILKASKRLTTEHHFEKMQTLRQTCSWLDSLYLREEMFAFYFRRPWMTMIYWDGNQMMFDSLALKGALSVLSWGEFC